MKARTINYRNNFSRLFILINIFFLIFSIKTYAITVCDVKWHEGKVPIGCNCLTAISSASITILGDARDSKTSKCITRKYCNKEEVCRGFIQQTFNSTNEINPNQEEIEN